MKRFLFILFSAVFFTLSVQAQRVRFDLSFNADSTADISKVYVRPMAADGSETKAIPLRLKDGRYTARIPLSCSGFYEVVMIVNNGQWLSTVYSTEKEKVEIDMCFDGNSIMEISSPENRALSVLNAVVAANNRRLWLEKNMSDNDLRTLVESYVSVSDSIMDAMTIALPVAQYLKAMAYTNAQNLYESIPRAQGRSSKSIPFAVADVLASPEEVLDNEYAALLLPAMQLVFGEVTKNVGLGLDGMLEVLYEDYKCEAVRSVVADMAVKRFLARYNYTVDFDGGLEYLKAVVDDFGLSDFYVGEYLKRKAALKGAAFPEDVVLVDADGNEVDFSSFKGKYVYVDLWASWCAPCCKEIPYLQALEKEMAGGDVVFMSISTDTDVQAWKNRMAELGMKGNQLLDRDGSLTQVLNVGGIPFFLVYDKEGKLHTYGAVRPSSGDELKRFLGDLQ